MAGKTISQLPLATTPLAGTESVPIVRSGVTYKTTVADVAKAPQDGATANAVTYYDGDKMPASNAGFRYDGVNVTATGTVSAAKLIPTGTSAAGTGIYSPSANAIAWSNNGVQTMQLDASGNLGLGVTPSASTVPTLQLASQVTLSSGGNSASFAQNAIRDTSWKYITTAAATLYQHATGAHFWYTAPSGTAGNAITFTQAMTLDAGGNLLVGTTTSGFSNANGFNITNAAGNTYISIGHPSGAPSGQAYAGFLYNSATIGSITQNGTTAVAYNTTSDHRLKNNVTPLSGALAKVQALKPSEFDWIDGRHDDGFIAHELQAVLPNVVTGEKDAVDEDGKPKYQQVDYARIVPTLCAAIQEQQAIIEQLTARIVALEAK